MVDTIVADTERWIKELKTIDPDNKVWHKNLDKYLENIKNISLDDYIFISLMRYLYGFDHPELGDQWKPQVNRLKPSTELKDWE